MIPVNDLAGFLPHADKMVWIDYVLETTETGGTCKVIVDSSKHYSSDEGIRQSSFIEWMAQGFGFVNAAHNLKNKIEGSVTNAFLVGFNNVVFKDALPSHGEVLLITTHVTRTIGPINYIEGKVESSTGTLYCEAQLKLFST